jgi:hypothetical protein
MPTHLITFHVIAIVLPGEECGLLGNFLHPPVTFFFLGLHIPVSTLFTTTLGVCSFLMPESKFHAHKK